MGHKSVTTHLPQPRDHGRRTSAEAWLQRHRPANSSVGTDTRRLTPPHRAVSRLIPKDNGTWESSRRYGSIGSCLPAFLAFPSQSRWSGWGIARYTGGTGPSGRACQPSVKRGFSSSLPQVHFPSASALEQDLSGSRFTGSHAPAGARPPKKHEPRKRSPIGRRHRRDEPTPTNPATGSNESFTLLRPRGSPRPLSRLAQIPWLLRYQSRVPTINDERVYDRSLHGHAYSNGTGHEKQKLKWSIVVHRSRHSAVCPSKQLLSGAIYLL